MTKRYSDTLRERAKRLRESVAPDVTSDIVNEPWSEGDCAACGVGIRLARGYPTRGAQICEGCEVDAKARACAFDEVADELDSPEFSGRIVYEQRNAALEEAARLKQRIAELERYAWRPITADSMPPRDSVVECWQREHAGTCEVQWGNPSPDREPVWWIGYRYCTDEQLRRVCSHWRYLTPPETAPDETNAEDV